jgi:cytoskeleton protein RodZ
MPGGVYTRGFIRTYATFLGLDGDRLVGEYRESVEPWHRAADAQQSEPGGGATPSGLRSVVLGGLVVVAVVAVAVIAIVAIPSGGGGESGPGPRRHEVAGKAKPEVKPPVTPAKTGVTIELSASAEVWACLLNAKGRALVDGLILEAGAKEGPFHSGSFTVSFGNGEVKMLIDGREAEIPATSSPVGYAIDSAGKLTKLGEAERPSCT